MAPTGFLPTYLRVQKPSCYDHGVLVVRSSEGTSWKKATSERPVLTGIAF